MKKTIIVVLILFYIVGSLFSQENEKKDSLNNKNIMPESGDMSFSIDAAPVFSFFGNMLSEAGNNSLDLQLPTSGQTFLFKYVKNENTFFRAKVRLGFSSVIDKELIKKADQEDLTNTVEDAYKQNQSNFEFYLGMEKRRGFKRLKGFYGAEAGFVYYNEKDVYKYGNKIEDENDIIFNTINFNDNVNLSTHPEGYAMRLLNKDYGSNLGINIGLFIGAEYFFTEKISLAGEFGWYFYYNFIGQSYSKYEYWDPDNSKISEYEITSLGGIAYGFDNNPKGMLTFSIYF